MADLKITLIKSINNVKRDQASTVKALGLKKIGSFVVQKDVPSIRGMIRKVTHLVNVEEISEGVQG